MQTNLSDAAKTLSRADEAEQILRSCVHCGFCNATCPTYQLLGNELDGPRGRIYLIKQMLEGEPVTQKTQLHLDRCLSCRNCETTCPSGVTYHALLDIGRAELAQRIVRPAPERLLREGLRRVIPNPAVFRALLKTGQAMRPFLPAALGRKIPKRSARPNAGTESRPASRHPRKMLMLEGCVQPALSPDTNAAAARVLDRLGISIVNARQAGCCGATDYHLDAQETGLARARRNIDAWWPAIEAGAEAIVQTASGCGAFVKEYGHLLRHDPRYASKAQRVSELTRDLVEVLANEPLDRLQADQLQAGALPKLPATLPAKLPAKLPGTLPGTLPATSPDQARRKIAFHCPCTLQHAQKLGGAVESVLQRLGFDLAAVPDAHLCCGSAGTYSITQPALAERLRNNRLDALESGKPEMIVTANIGCQTHLNGAGRTPVRHWIELVEASLP
ncbi:glycolate oxidase subunit GlcF [Paraburkholderia fungorum]|uniref:Glycolate oxidase iron-sulfur subunit n=1 Tax=Paraburkholderia fungorum TaxID=134537 RepID=A0A3R7ENK1_9BURK|nr:glycolate oxidase subunit GlcF [Paraburkholderia fungorum]RKF33465.1 glycolate oxidase iron-sulfur subunit [Paraburkholderia fungorum]